MDVTSENLASELEIDPEEFNNAVRDHAKFLGIDPDMDAQFLYIAQEALLAPLPDDWDILSEEDSEGSKKYYYFNENSGLRTEENPLDEKYRRLFVKTKKEMFPEWETQGETFHTLNPLMEDLSEINFADGVSGDGAVEKEGHIFSTPNPLQDFELDENCLVESISGYRKSYLGHRNCIASTEYLVKLKDTTNVKWVSSFVLLDQYPSCSTRVTEYNEKNNIKIDMASEKEANDRLQNLNQKWNSANHSTHNQGERAAEVASLKKSIKSIELNFAEKEDILRSQVRALSAELLEFQQLLTEEEEKGEELKSQLKRQNRLEEELVLSREELNSMNIKYKGVQESLSRIQNVDFVRLEKFATEKDSENLNLKKTVNDLEGMITRQDAHFNSKLNDFVLKVKSIKKEAVEKDEEIALLQIQLSESKDRIEEISKMLERVNKEKKALELRLTQARSEKEKVLDHVSELKEKLGDVSESQSKNERSLHDIEKENHILSRRLSEKESSLQVTQKEVEALVKNESLLRQELKKNMTTLQEKYEWQANIAKEVDTERKRIETEYKALSKDLEQSVNNCLSLENRLKHREASLIAMERQYKELEETLAKSEEQRIELSERKVAQTDEQFKIQHTLRQEVKDLSEENSELKRQRDNLEAEVKKVLNSKVQNTSEMETLENELKEAKSEVDSFKKRLSRCQKETELALVARTKQLELLRKQETENFQKQIAKRSEENEKRLETMSAVLQVEVKRRRQINSRLIDIQGNIRVFCRIRPSLGAHAPVICGGKIKGCLIVGEIENSKLVEDNFTSHSLDSGSGSQRAFEFHEVFPSSSSQEQVFDEVRPLVQSFQDGYDVCIFAYGQTGSGKTFTMEGQESAPGMLRQSVKQIFETEYDAGAILEVAMLEVYNETLRDLILSPGKSAPSLEIRMDEDGGQFVKGLSKIRLELGKHGSHHCLETIRRGSLHRTQGSHQLNSHSSRSHLVVMLELYHGHRRSKMYLIDLAGSERLDRTGATGDTLNEAKFINKSLSALGNVIQALLRKNSRTHVPYRDSKLTYLLKDSLSSSSGAKVAMFVCVAPEEEHLKESLCAIKFGRRCMQVKLGAARKKSEEVSRLKAKVIELSRKIRSLTK